MKLPLIKFDTAVAITDKLVDRYGFEMEPADETDYRSYLGTPVYSPLEFLGTSGTSRDNSQEPFEGVLLRIDTCIITVDMTKNIVKTAIQGRAGTVKEYISNGDYMVFIRGLITSPYVNVYPQDDASLFEEIMNLPKQIPVASKFLQLFNIDALCVEQWGFDEVEGSRNQIAFRISASSDFAEEIILNPNNGL